MVKTNEILDAIENMILDKLSETHTMTIGKIVKVNNTTIDVKPIYKRFVNNMEIEYPVFPNIPPIFLNGGSNFQSFPLEVGDYCMLMVAERSIDNWYEGLDDKIPLEYRMFDYSDSIALVGLRPRKQAIPIPTDGRTHQVGDTYQQGNYEHVGNRVQTGDFNLTGNFTINGNLIINGNATINNGDLTVGGVSFSNHVHMQNDGNDQGGGVNTDKATN